MLPNIKQRINARNKGKNREVQEEGFEDIQHITISLQRIDRRNIWSRRNGTSSSLYCRFRLKNNQKRFGLIKALGWNLEVLNRLQCANKLGLNVTQCAIPN